MTKQQAVKQLDTVIGKLIYISSNIQGNAFQTAIREVTFIRYRVESEQLTIKKK